MTRVTPYRTPAARPLDPEPDPFPESEAPRSIERDRFELELVAAVDEIIGRDGDRSRAYAFRCWLYAGLEEYLDPDLLERAVAIVEAKRDELRR